MTRVKHFLLHNPYFGFGLNMLGLLCMLLILASPKPLDDFFRGRERLGVIVGIPTGLAVLRHNIRNNNSSAH